MFVTQNSFLSGKVGQQLERTFLFIDEHLEEEITVEQVARDAGISSFLFQRLFCAYLGETLHHYVLRRRLDFAAKNIIHNKKIILAEIASSLGFETPRAFTNAFIKQFNITPSTYRNAPFKAKLAEVKSVSFIHSKPENNMLDVSVEELPTLWMNHECASGAIDGGMNKEGNQQISSDFKALLRDNEFRLYGLATTYLTKEQTINDSSISVLYGGLYSEKNDAVMSDAWLEIDGGLWAVCRHKGEYGNLSQTWMSVIHLWLPKSGYELRDAVAFELYQNMSDKLIKFDDALIMVYLPIKKAESEH